MTEKKVQIKKESIILSIALLLLFCIFGWRQFYGFNKNDEIFYISTVYRFFQGDAMLADEWNNVQLFAFITYPLYSLIRCFYHSNEGIVLIFRFLYLFFQLMVSVYCYMRMKRFGWIRIMPVLFYFVTTPYNINSMSYNTLALGFMLLILVTIASVEKLRAGDSFLCGIFVAGAVLANPYVVLLFIGYGCVCLIDSYDNRKRKTRILSMSFRNYLWMCLGAFTIFILFVVFVLSRASIQEILECISYIVFDKERKKPFFQKFLKYFIRIHRYYKILVYAAGISIILLLFDKRKKIPKAFYLIINSLITIFYIVYYGFFWEMVGINYMLIPIAFPGLIAFLLTKNKDRLLFFGWYVPGLLYTLLAHFATDTGIYTVSASYMLAGTASVLLIWKCMEECLQLRLVKILVYSLFAIQFISCVWQRITYVWGDEHLEYLTCEIEEGPLKWIYTSKENKQLYNEVLQDMSDLNLTEKDKLAVIGIAPWMYLNTEAKCGASSTWETLENDPNIPIYYKIRQEKLPTVIYFYEYENDILDSEISIDFLNLGYQSSVLRHGVVLQRR